MGCKMRIQIVILFGFCPLVVGDGGIALHCLAVVIVTI